MTKNYKKWNIIAGTSIGAILLVSVLALGVLTPQAEAGEQNTCPNGCPNGNGFPNGEFFSPIIVTSSSAGAEDFTTTVIMEKEVFPIFDEMGNTNGGNMMTAYHLIADREIQIITKIVVSEAEDDDEPPVETLEVFAIICDKFNVQDPDLFSVEIQCVKRDLDLSGN